MKQTLLIITALMLVVGCSESDAQQKVITVTETYKDGDVSKISYHKITGNKIELVKEINWYENGQKSIEGTYKDGKRERKWTHWSPDGKESSELIYKDGKAWDGVEMWVGYNDWIKHGVMEKVESYKNGKRDGKWIEHDFSSTGKVKKLRTYKDGELVEETRWDEDGNERKDDGDSRTNEPAVLESVGEIRE